MSMNLLKFEDILMGDLDQLKGSNVLAAPSVASVLLKRQPHKNDSLNSAFAKEFSVKVRFLN